MKEKIKSQKMTEKIYPITSLEILPLKDFEIKHNDTHIIIKKGELIEIPVKFLQNLKTEKVME